MNSLALPDQALRRRLVLTASIVLAAAGLILLAGVILSWLTGGAPPPPPKNPFGIGIREGGAPSNSLVGWILATQADFYRQLSSAVRAIARDGSAGLWLAWLGFAYGVFHAAGPGHGKAVIAAWIVANERALGRGIAMAFAAAALQAVVAVALVTLLAGALRVTASRMTAVTQAVEWASFAAVALVGAMLLVRKAGALAALISPVPHAHAPGEDCGPDCGHLHMPGPQAETASWRSMAGVVAAAGVRPCSGAILVLVFALSQGVFAAGVAATFAMALGTALTTGALAALAVLFKATALRVAGGHGQGGRRVLAVLEVGAAAFVTVFGLALLTGLWSA